MNILSPRGYHEVFANNQAAAEARKMAEKQVAGVKTGNVLDVAGKKMKVVGFTGSEADRTSAFMMEELTPEELQAFEKREGFIVGAIKRQIEADPSATVNVEQARKNWGKIYDAGASSNTLEADLNEVYAKRYEEAATLAQERFMVLEQQLNSVKSEAEKQSLLSQIQTEVKFATEMRQEAEHRRSY